MESDKDHAIHESSHAVLGWYLGAKICSVTISGPKLESRGGTPWHCIFEHPGMVPLERLSSTDINLRLMTNLAPFALRQDRNLYGDLADVFEAMNFLAWYRRPGHRAMAEKAAELLGGINPEEPSDTEEFFSRHGWKAEKFCEQFAGPVKDLLADKNISNCIERLADKLVEKGRLTGFETAQFLEKTWKGPLPEKIKPAQEHPAGVSSSSPENAVESVRGLIKMALGILQGVDDFDAVEEPMRAVLQCLFQFEELSARNG